MDINIAENIRRLRTQKGVTQETLAGFLGVSSQAVSKWERGDGLPDITMLPPLAAYFDVTLDELMSMNEFRNKEELEKMKRRYRRLCSCGNNSEAAEVMREVLRRFPNDYGTMAQLAEYGDDPDEGIALCRRILQFCPDNDLRSYAAYQEASLLHTLGRSDEALERTRELCPLEYCRELNIMWLLSGEARVKQCQSTVMSLGWAFFGQIEQLAGSGVYDEETCIALYQKALDLYALIYDDGNLGYSHLRVSNCYFSMGLYALELGQHDRAVGYFRHSAEHAKLFDALPAETPLTSLLTDRCVFERDSADGVGSYADHCRDLLLQKERLRIGGQYAGDYAQLAAIFE